MNTPTPEEQTSDSGAVCPHCLHLNHVEAEDYNPDEREQECTKCGKPFLQRDDFTVAHHTRPLPPTPEIQIVPIAGAWQKVAKGELLPTDHRIECTPEAFMERWELVRTKDGKSAATGQALSREGAAETNAETIKP